MSATHVLDPIPGLPAGTTVELHAESAFPGGVSAPIGATLATVVTDAAGHTTFSGLAYDTDFWAYAAATGQRVRFRTEADPGMVPISSAEALDIRSGLDAVESRAVDARAYATLQAAIDVGLLLGAKVVFPPSTYNTAVTTNLYSDTELEFQPGAVINFTGGDLGVCFKALGTEGAPVALTANTVANGITVTAPGHGLVAGDRFRIGSTAKFDPGRTDIPIGEIAEVLSVAGNDITIRSPLMGGPYLTADAAVVSKLSLVENLSIKGPGEVRGTVGNRHFGFQLDRCRNVDISGVRMLNVGIMAFQLIDCLDVTVDSVRVEHSNEDNGYGVSVVNCCQGVTIANSHFRDCRHPTSTNNYTTRAGVVRYVTVHHCHAWDNVAGQDAFDAHPAAEHVAYLHNTIYDAGNNGINVECPSAQVEGNTIVNAGNSGIVVINHTLQPTNYRVRGNTIIRAAQYGIRFTSSATSDSFGASIDELAIDQNTIISPGTYGIWCESASATWRVHGASICDNKIRGASNFAVYLTRADECIVDRNRVRDHIVSVNVLRFNDVTGSSMSHNRLGFDAAGGSDYAMRVIAGTDLTINANRVKNATAGGGLQLDAATTHCTITFNNCRDATVTSSRPWSFSTGAGHVIYGNKPGPLGPGMQTVNTNLNLTFAPMNTPERTLHTGTLTADRTVTLSTSNAYIGQRFKITRTGPGAFNLLVGTGPLKALATGQWCTVEYDGTAWFLAEFGSL